MIPIAAFRGRTVAVYGLARSGLAAARALQAGGAKVAAWDDAAARREAAKAFGISVQEQALDGAEAVVLSPGIPLTHPEPHAVVREARARQVEVIGDVELLFRQRTGAQVIGITGTNGKSTTTALIGHILKSAGKDVQVGGNIGAAVLDLEPLGKGGIYVVELSSFQIDLTPSLDCAVSILLNITPDHLDRHGDMDGYVAVKKRIFAGTGSAIIGVDDDWGRRIHADLVEAGHRHIVPVSVERELVHGITVIGPAFTVTMDGRVLPEIDLRAAPALIGKHNHQNAAAAIAAALEMGVSVKDIGAALKTFPGLAHRLERIAEINGVGYFNDSKATNADAAAKALAAFERIHWIAGGKPKAGGIEPLAAYFPRIAHAYLIGEAAEGFARTLQGKVPCTLCGTLDRAVEAAHAAARPGEAVVLSPACASYDQFSDFEARGEAFRRLVLALPGRDA